MAAARRPAHTPIKRPNDSGLSKSLDKAKALHSAGRLKEAKRAYKKLLSRRPQDAELRYLAGHVSWQAGDAKEAEAHLRRAARLQPTYLEAHIDLGLMLVELGRLSDALECFVQSVELQPDSVIALQNIALLSLKLDRYEEAITYYDRLLEQDPDGVETYVNRGIALQRLGSLQEALASFKQALDRKPDYALAALNLGVTFQKLNRLDEAESNLRRAVALDPSNSWYTFVFGSVLLERQNIVEAFQQFRKAVDLDPENDAALNNLQMTRRYRQDFGGEIAECRTTLLAQPNDATVKIKLASLLWQTGQLDTAATLLDSVHATGIPDGGKNYWLGLVHQSKNDSIRACQFLERALTLDPNDVHAEAALANITSPEPALRNAAPKRVALHISQRYHYRILKPVFDALCEQGHACCLTPHVNELIAFRPDFVIVAESQAPFLRDLMPDALFVWVRHGLISKNTTMHAARVADFACLTSESSRDWYIQHGGQPRRDFWITGYPQMDVLFRPGELPLGVEIESDRKVVLYAPTWTPGLSSAEMLGDRIAEFICGRRSDITLVIKPHPVTENQRPEWVETWREIAAARDDTHIFDDPAADIMPLLKRADVLVSDASSVMFQYLAVDRPLVLITNPDRSSVSHYDPRGIEWQWRDVGREVHDPKQVAGAVSDALDYPARGKEMRAQYRRELFGRYTDGRAGERIAQKIEEFAL
jgi:Flp pilus assembly protein TadD